jgi:hypothetical protein
VANQTPAEIVGKNIEKARKSMVPKVSQHELGERMGKYLRRKWLPQTVSVAVSGGRRFSAEELIALAAVLGTTPTALLTPPDPATTVSFETGLSVAWADLAPRGNRLAIEHGGDELEAAVELLIRNTDEAVDTTYKALNQTMIQRRAVVLLAGLLRGIDARDQLAHELDIEEGGYSSILFGEEEEED